MPQKTHAAPFYKLGFSVFCFGLILILARFALAQTYEIGNRHISRQVTIAQQRLASAKIANRRTGESMELSGVEFALTAVSPKVEITPAASNVIRLSSADCIVDSTQQQKAPSGESRLTIFLHAENLPLTFHLVYTVSSDQVVIKKRLFWRQQPGAELAPYFVERLWLEDVRLSATTLSGGGYGQPVFSGNFFWGIEYPASEAVIEADHLSLAYEIGKTTTSTWQESYPAMVGAADAYSGRHDFITYINSMRPNPVEPYLLYNSWYDIRDFNYPEFFERINFFNKVLLQKYGEKLDALVLDDGWDDQTGKLWAVDQRKFPQELTPIGARLKDMGSSMGLWISPWGGYDVARQQRAKLAQQQGYETMGEFLCLAGPKYFELFRSRVLDCQQKFNIGFWKLDGFLSTCNRTDHSHSIGRFSRRQLLDRFLQILTELHAQRPDVRIDITVGTWQSPWWLKWADYVWMGGADYDFSKELPSFSQRDQSLTYRDQVMYDDLVTHGYIMPTSAFMTHGIIKGRLNMLGGENETTEAFLKDAVMYFSRGVSMWELYVTPSKLSQQEWDGLVQILRWARQNWPVLQHTLYVGGAPRRGEVYGYAHFFERRGLLTLRNPSAETQEFSLSRNLAIGKIDSATVLHILQRYPQQQSLAGAWKVNDKFTVRMPPYEVAVFEFLPEDEMPPVYVTGAPYRVVASSRSGMELQILPQAGRDYEVKLSAQVRVTTEASQLATNSMLMKPPQLRQFNWAAKKADMIGTVQVLVPENIQQPELVLLYQPAAPVDSVRLQKNSGKLLTGRKDGDGAWWWFTVPVQTGKQQMQLILKNGVALAGSVQLFLTGTPKQAPIRISLRGKISVNSLQTLPFAWDRHKQIYSLSEMRKLR